MLDGSGEGEGGEKGERMGGEWREGHTRLKE